MRSARKTFTWTTIWIGLALIGAGCHTGVGDAYEFDDGLGVMVMSLTDSNALRFEDLAVWDPGSDSELDHSEAPGVDQSATALLGGDPAGDPIVFKSEAPADLWFDLDEPMGGTMYVSNSAAGVHSDIFRVDLYVDGDYGGGMQFELTAESSGNGWNWFHVYFRPEVRMIPAGSEVAVHITPVATLTDLKIGTGGDMASHVAFAYLTVDPLAGALFLEDGEIVKTPKQRNATEEEDPEAGSLMTAPSAQSGSTSVGHHAIPTTHAHGAQHDPPVAADPTKEDDRDGLGLIALGGVMVIPAVGLLGLGGRLRGRQVVAALLMVSLALSGCAGKEDAKFQGVEDDDKPKPGVNETYEDLPDAEPGVEPKVGIGLVRGHVLNHFTLPIPNAHISFIGTSLFTRSGEDGGFEFPEVPAGKFSMRVDAVDYESLERTVTVHDGKVTNLEITLVPPGDLGADELQHLHDEWGGQTRRLVEKTQPFTVATEVYTQTAESSAASFCVPHYGLRGGSEGQRSTDVCVWDVPTDFSNRILPGTATVEVIIEWNHEADNAPPELGVAFEAPKSSSWYYNQYQTRASGVPTMIQVFPNWADPGHQQFTNWEFRIITPPVDLEAPWSEPYWEIPDIVVSIYIHKGVVPYEPAHTDRWGEATSFELVDGETRKSLGCTTNCIEEEGGWMSYSSTKFDVAKDTWVPSGTDYIEGEVIITNVILSGTVTVGLPVNSPYTDYALGVKGANIPAGEAQGNLRIIEDVTYTDSGFTFKFKPLDKELDQWYQHSSGWDLYVVQRSDVHPYYYGAQAYLSATVHKDPNWKISE